MLTFGFIVFVIFAAAAVAFFSRMDGGGEPKTPEIVERLLCISPFFFLGCFIHPAAALSSLTGYGGRATGHGQYFPDVEGKIIKSSNTEFVDPFVRLFFGKDPRVDQPDHETAHNAVLTYGLKKLHIRCFFGMACTGLLVTLAIAIASFYFGHILIGLFMLLAGIGKAVSYQIGYRLLKSPTEAGEYINGFQQGIFAFTSIAILMSSYIM